MRDKEVTFYQIAKLPFNHRKSLGKGYFSLIGNEINMLLGFDYGLSTFGLSTFGIITKGKAGYRAKGANRNVKTCMMAAYDVPFVERVRGDKGKGYKPHRRGYPPLFYNLPDVTVSGREVRIGRHGGAYTAMSFEGIPETMLAIAYRAFQYMEQNRALPPYYQVERVRKIGPCVEWHNSVDGAILRDVPDGFCAEYYYIDGGCLWLSENPPMATRVLIPRYSEAAKEEQ
jgi:hypothetical protein